MGKGDNLSWRATVDLSLSGQKEDPFLSFVERRKSHAVERLEPAPGEMFRRVTESKNFEKSAVVSQIMTTAAASISSRQDLILTDCPVLHGDVSAQGDLILVGCPDNGKVSAGRNIYSLNSDLSQAIAGGTRFQYFSEALGKEYCFRDGSADFIETFFPTVRLINFIVRGPISFFDEQGEPFRGKVIMDSKSRLDDRLHTDAEIICSEVATTKGRKRKAEVD